MHRIGELEIHLAVLRRAPEWRIKMKDSDCIFCKLANGDIPTRVLYEDEDFTAFLDTAPATRGHALLVPKEHYGDLFSMPEELVGRAFAKAKELAGQIREKAGAEGFNLVQNNGRLAGQTVFHFHIHMIPRYAGDGQGIGWKPGSPADSELDEVLKQLKLS